MRAAGFTAAVPYVDSRRWSLLLSSQVTAQTLRCRAPADSLHRAAEIISTGRVPRNCARALLKALRTKGCTKRSSAEPFAGSANRCRPRAARSTVASTGLHVALRRRCTRGLTRRGPVGVGIQARAARSWAAKNPPTTAFATGQCPGEGRCDACKAGGDRISQQVPTVETGDLAANHQKLSAGTTTVARFPLPPTERTPEINLLQCGRTKRGIESLRHQDWFAESELFRALTLSGIGYIWRGR